MWEIWANIFLPKALKNCPKSNKLPNLVTLVGTNGIGTLRHLGPILIPTFALNKVESFG